jgi:hypothetical protein
MSATDKQATGSGQNMPSIDGYAIALEKSDVLQTKKLEASFKQLLSKAEAILSDNCFQDTAELQILLTQNNHFCFSSNR